MPPPNPAYATASERLVKARLAAGYATLEAAAIALGLDYKIYRSHEAGRYRVKPEELKRYAAAFGVSAGWLATGVGQGP